MCMKKQHLRIWLTLLSSLVSSMASAYDAKVGNIYYKFSGDEATVVDMNYTSGHPNWNENAYMGDVVIPETVTNDGKTYRVTANGDNAFNYCSHLTTVSIPNSVTSIGIRAFSGCSKLTSVNIPSGITEINSSTFAYCSVLDAIDIPEGITSIGASAFYGCYKLANISIPSSVRSVGESAFAETAWYKAISDGIIYVGKLLYGYKGKVPANTTIDIKEGTVCIGGGVFKNATGLIAINIPEGVEEIGANAFYGCTNLKSVNIPGSVQKIGGNAFYGCSNLESAVLPDGLETIPEWAFYNCKSLSSINSPSSLVTIEKYAFEGCAKLPSFTLGSKVKSIGQYAFKGCTSITSMEIPDNVETMADAAFMDCVGIERFVIGKGVKELTNQLFSNTHIKSLTVGPNVKTVSKTVFSTGVQVGQSHTYPVKIFFLANDLPSGSGYMYGSTTMCYNVKSTWTTFIGTGSYLTGTKIEFLNSKFEVDGVTYVPTSMADRTCDVIDCRYDDSNETVNIGPTVTYRGVTFKVNNILYYAFQENGHIKKLSLGNEGIVYKKAFYGCDNIEELKLNIKGSVSSNTFENCKALKKVEIGNEVTSLGEKAFLDCKLLEGIDIPNSVTQMGQYAFQGCTSLAYAKIGTGLTAISDYAFWTCTSLKDLQIGSNVASIGYNSFMGCSSLISLRIPKSVTTVDKAFMNCTSLKEVIIENCDTPISMTTSDFETCQLDTAYIGRNFGDKSPFRNCATLRAVKLAPTVTELGTEAFCNCDGLQNVHISQNITNIGTRAFSGCDAIEKFEVGYRVEKIGQEAFAGCTGLKTLVTYAVKPPLCLSLALNDVDKWECLLKIPEGTTEAYQAADQWKEFFFMENIELIPGDANLDGIVDAADIDEVRDFIMRSPTGETVYPFIDVNGDGVVNATDIVFILNILLNN